MILGGDDVTVDKIDITTVSYLEVDLSQIHVNLVGGGSKSYKDLHVVPEKWKNAIARVRICIR